MLSVHNSRENNTSGSWWREGDVLLRKAFEAIKRDLWVVVLDIVAVNISYYLALLIRFYVNFRLRPVAVDRYLPAFIGFAPFYTGLSLIIFMMWRLYGGLWRYAGINDMNRIIGASLCTTVVQVAGTSLFFTRMPITYYLIGAVLQFGFVVAIRFGYRVLLVEKRRLRRGERINTVVVGSGENGRRVVKNLEESELYRPVTIYSSSTSSSHPSSATMDGIPIVGELKLENVGALFIADPLMSGEERTKIKEQCGERIEFHDYTGYFSNLGGRLSLTELMSVVKGPVVIELDGVEKSYEDGTAALRSLSDKYEIKEIVGQTMKIKLEKARAMSTQERLAQVYASVAGDDR